MQVMNAVVKVSVDHAELRELPIPTCGVNDVLVKVRSAALCGTDLHILAWNSWAQGAGIELPFVLGHECCGDVVAVGAAVTGFGVGDKVAAETHVPCGVCYQCRNGEQHICKNLKLFGIHMDGCFAEYTLIPAICARKLPMEIDYNIGSMMEPLGTAFRSVYDAQVGGAKVLVVGCGPIGLFAVASARALGAGLVVATDVSPYRLDIAGKVGADLALDPRETEITDKIMAITDGIGFDVVIEASGSGCAINQAFTWLRKGGTVAMVGLPSAPVALELGKMVVFKEAKIFGVHGRRMFSTWTAVENLLVAGKLNVAPVMTHLLPLDRWKEGVDLASTGLACKVVVNP